MKIEVATDAVSTISSTAAKMRAPQLLDLMTGVRVSCSHAGDPRQLRRRSELELGCNRIEVAADVGQSRRIPGRGSTVLPGAKRRFARKRPDVWAETKVRCEVGPRPDPMSLWARGKRPVQDGAVVFIQASGGT